MGGEINVLNQTEILGNHGQPSGFAKTPQAVLQLENALWSGPKAFSASPVSGRAVDTGVTTLRTGGRLVTRTPELELPGRPGHCPVKALDGSDVCWPPWEPITPGSGKLRLKSLFFLPTGGFIPVLLGSCSVLSSTSGNEVRRACLWPHAGKRGRHPQGGQWKTAVTC